MITKKGFVKTQFDRISPQTETIHLFAETFAWHYQSSNQSSPSVCSFLKYIYINFYMYLLYIIYIFFAPGMSSHSPCWSDQPHSSQRARQPIKSQRPHGPSASGEVSGERSQRQRSAAAVPVNGRVRVPDLCYCTQRGNSYAFNINAPFNPVTSFLCLISWLKKVSICWETLLSHHLYWFVLLTFQAFSPIGVFQSSVFLGACLRVGGQAHWNCY